MMLGLFEEALEKLADQDDDQVSDQVVALLEVLGTRELSAVELMGELGLLHRPTFRAN